MKILKQTTAALLALVLVLGILPLSSMATETENVGDGVLGIPLVSETETVETVSEIFAEETAEFVGGDAPSSGTCGENLTWTLADGVLTISGRGRMHDFKFGEAPWYEQREVIVSASIETGVTSIGYGAFYNCHLVQVAIPDSVTDICNAAFNSCHCLENIVIPGSVISIGNNAFADCMSLANVTISEGVTYIGEYAFFACTSLTSITIPDSVMEIGSDAFRCCTSLKSVILSAGNSSIAPYLFGECRNLTRATIPYGILSIGEYAFNYCERLTNIVLPASLDAIGAYAFHECSCLTSIFIPSSVSYIGSGALYFCDSLLDVYFGGSQVQWNVMHVELPKDVTVHYNCTGLDNEGSIPDENVTACPLSELTEVDFLAFSAIVYKDLSQSATVEAALTDLGLWKQEWDTKQGITYSLLCTHIANWEPFYIHENTDTGFFAAAFRNQYQEVVLAYRGSESLVKVFSDKDAFLDWFSNDFPIILGNSVGSQFYDALLAYTEASQGATIVTTGHSLGGALGDIVSAYSGCRGITFNAVPALDAVYRVHTKKMAPLFTGVDNWNFTDHVNKSDYIAGTFEVLSLNRIKPYVSYLGNTQFPHNLQSLVYINDDGIVVMNATTGAYHPTSVISNYMTFALESIDLGTSGNDAIAKGFSMFVPRTSYGGAGVDQITTSIHCDTIIGGQGADDLDGSWGDDTYIYCLGDGCDIIRDVSGKDTLELCGLNSSSDITTRVSSDGNFVNIYCDDDLIVSIFRKNRAALDNSFTIQYDGITQSVTAELKAMQYSARMAIACPVNVEILDEEEHVVYTIYDGVPGNFYTDYGNFYVYQVETGGYGKTLDLVKGYSARIVGTNAGTMDITYWSVENGQLAECQIISDIPITNEYIATLEENENGEVQLKPAITHDCQLGDVNHDTKINAKDATLILQKSVGVLKETAPFCEACAEVSGDGKLNAKDSTLILQFSVGLRQDFPGQK